jgi:exonuclease III
MGVSLNIASLNINGLGIVSQGLQKLASITSFLSEHVLDIVCIQEIRHPAQALFHLNKYFTQYTCFQCLSTEPSHTLDGRSSSRSGVAILVSSALLSSN